MKQFSCAAVYVLYLISQLIAKLLHRRNIVKQKLRRSLITDCRLNRDESEISKRYSRNANSNKHDDSEANKCRAAEKLWARPFYQEASACIISSRSVN